MLLQLELSTVYASGTLLAAELPWLVYHFPVYLTCEVVFYISSQKKKPSALFFVRMIHLGCETHRTVASCLLFPACHFPWPLFDAELTLVNNWRSASMKCTTHYTGCVFIIIITPFKIFLPTPSPWSWMSTDWNKNKNAELIMITTVNV